LIIGGLPDFEDRIGDAGRRRASTVFCVNHNFVVSIAKVKSEMERGFLARIIDRVAANARVIRRAPEAVALMGIMVVGVSYIGFQHYHRERVAALNERIASQEGLLAEYRTKLKGATPDEVATQIGNLTSLLDDARKSLREAKSKPASVENRSRDPRRLYEDNDPIALTQDPKIDTDRKKIIFPVVSASVILEINKVYEFQNWKVTCGGTQLYSTVADGVGHEYSYSPLTCKILGNR
jgi:hypothetical protein